MGQLILYKSSLDFTREVHLMIYKKEGPRQTVFNKP